MLAAALLLLGASGAWAVPATAAPARAKPPHIMLVLIDDLGYHNVGFHNPDQISPNINALVKDGILLEAHYTFQFCSPTRSSFLSGRLPIHVNTANRAGTAVGGVDIRMSTVADQLSRAGGRLGGSRRF